MSEKITVEKVETWIGPSIAKATFQTAIDIVKKHNGDSKIVEELEERQKTISSIELYGQFSD